jgi:hypothetical protein
MIRIGRRGLLGVVLVACVGAWVPLQALALSPPWYILQAQFEAALERDPCVTVDRLVETSPSRYELNVRVCDRMKGKALSTLLTRQESFGAIVVDIDVFDLSGEKIAPDAMPSDPARYRSLVGAALTGNCLFIGTRDGNPINAFFIEFAKAVVQYWGDNLADAYGNINEVAAAAFYDVLGLSDLAAFSVQTTTSPTYIWGCGGGGDKG